MSEGQQHDVAHAESLVKHIGNFEYFIADKGFDSKTLRELIASLNKTSVIPKRNYSKDLKPGTIDKHLVTIQVSPLKLDQKISGCFRSMKGAEMFCRIRSYISTCQKHGITVFDALESLFMHNTYPKFIQDVIDKMPTPE